jgi:hypothetical protein
LLLPTGQKVALPSAIEVSGDVLASATTLAGLVLVFLGATYTSYEAYPAIMRDTKVRARYRRRAWFGFAGFALALLAASAALLGKWLHEERSALAAIGLFGTAMVWVVVAAVLAVRDIR